MKSVVLIAIAALVALAAGVAVTGLPTSVPDDIVATDIESVPVTTTTSPPSTSSTAPPVPSATTAAARPTPTPTSRPTTTTDAPVTSSSSETTFIPPTAAPTTTLTPAAQTRVVVANAGGANGLAARYADRLRGLGYAQVDAANASQRRDSSVVYWGPGWEDEARRLASELGIGATEPLPPDPIVLGRFDGDVWALVGLDLQ